MRKTYHYNSWYACCARSLPARAQSVNNSRRCPYFSAKIGIQLSKLGSALAATRKKTEIGREELKALLRIGKDTIPKKAKVLQRDLELEKRKEKIKK